MSGPPSGSAPVGPGPGGERRPRRTYSARPKHTRETDLQERSLRLWRLGFSPVGLLFGVLLGVLGRQTYGWPGWAILVTSLAGWALVYYGPHLLVHLVGRAGSGIYNPSGASTPRDKEYSYEESLVSRGSYEEAATAFELAVQEDPADPEPYLRLARILRDHLGRYEDAARWLRRVQRNARLPPGQAFLARKELVELYRHRMGQPTRAAPELARMSEEHAGSPEGEWAARELAEIKEVIARERETG